MARVEYKVIIFDVYDRPIIEGTKKVARQVGTKQVVKKKVFGEEETVEEPVYEYDVVPNITGYSNSQGDAARLKGEMEKSLNELATQGWHVVSIETVLRGMWKIIDGMVGRSAGFIPVTYNYSLTDAFVVVLEREVAES